MSSSDSDDENTIRYGTPLEPYEEDEVPSKRKYQQPPDQYAVDAHGRRRFHGAFTGGFSAGFGNTVGTPEGWAPATFKSSRSEKAQVSTQRPEDFMDDEDRGEHGIAPRHMETQSEFSGRKRPLQKQYHDGPIPGEPVLEQVVRAVHETAAVRMLRAMGWRPGQGAGQRLSRSQKKASREQHRVYGCYMPEELRPTTEPQSDSSDSEFEYDTLFAPDDYEPYVLRRKSDRFGLGYSGLSRHSVLGSMAGEYGQGATSHLVMKEKGKKVSIRGQAFGVGALEADDEDIYATEDMSHYDFALGGATEEKQKTKDKRENNVLEGFVRSSKPLPPVPAHAPPALPRDYAPLPAGARRSRFEPSSAPQRDQGLGRHELSAEARGALLGETPVPKSSLPTTQTDPIAQLLGRNVNFVTTDNANSATDNVDSTSTDKAEDFISIKDSGKEIKKVFKPFVADPAKQARYEKYLKDKDSVLEREGEIDRLTAWERNREISEFEQAAKLYKPLSGVMGDRFTHASEPDDALNPLTAVAKSCANRGLATPAQVEAARVGAYGVLTRADAPWRPAAVVCKRFNVPELGARGIEQKKEDRPKVSYSIFNYMESSVHDKESFAKEQTKFSGSKSLNREAVTNEKSNEVIPEKANVNKRTDTINVDPKPSTSSDTGFNKRMTVAELFLKESENDLKSQDNVEVTETINKFDKMDLYKSIFLSDSDNEDNAKGDVNISDTTSSVFDSFNDFFDVPQNVERNLSPPRGIFANIDFDEINSWKRNAEKKAEESTEVKNSTIGETTSGSKNNEVREDDIYGPKVPDNLKKRLEEMPERDKIIEKPKFRSKSEREVIAVSSSSSDSWVEAKEVMSKKKKKKNKKHKKQKKSKHKKKDR